VRVLPAGVAVVAAAAAVAVASGASSAKQLTRTSGHAASSTIKKGHLTIDLVTSIPAGDPFYAVVAKAGQVAARNLGVTVKYVSPPTYTTSAQQMSELLQTTLAAHPDGVAMTLPFPTLVPQVKSLIAAGIPVALFNAGKNQFAQTGALAYFGENSLQEGRDMGKRLKAAGVTNVLCPDLPLGTVQALDQRCQGVAQGIAPGKETRISITQVSAVPWENAIVAAVDKDKTINGVVGLGASVSAATLAARSTLGARGKKIKWATFDLGTPTLKGVIDGQYLFAEDQQEFLQTYDAIQTVVLYDRYGLAPGTQVVSTSAPVVGKAEARALLRLAAKEYR
jgi:simple sugar transport system substrate-binding protein